LRTIDVSTIGLTATVPVEILLAAGAAPLDLNNVFITSPDPAALVAEAEQRGFPINCCAWIKGIYATARRLGVRRVIGVAQGDCSNTHALMDMFASEGIEVIAFNYPFPRDAAALGQAIDDLARRLGTTRAAAEDERRRLAPLRRTLAEIDRLTWQEGRVTGEENHLWLIGSSDFGGDPVAYARAAEAFLAEARARPPATMRHRLGFIGIPPIAGGLYGLLENLGARVVFNEFQRQFSMPPGAGASEDPDARQSAVSASDRSESRNLAVDKDHVAIPRRDPSASLGVTAKKDLPETASLDSRERASGPQDLVDQYLAYTYPYGIVDRIDDLRRAVAERRLDGLVHYVQSFCFRHLQDRLLREALELPILTLEFDRPAPVDSRSRTRVEAFVEMLDTRTV
jgi:benzoyl-CoA reductase/2-hydroxyglutaryl-CoA dehydratase subunit BcrC/BadD/HgdB